MNAEASAKAVSGVSFFSLVFVAVNMRGGSQVFFCFKAYFFKRIYIQRKGMMFLVVCFCIFIYNLSPYFRNIGWMIVKEWIINYTETVIYIYSYHIHI